MKFKANRDKLYLWIISLLNIVFGTIVIVFCLSETYLGAVLFLIAIAVINTLTEIVIATTVPLTTIFVVPTDPIIPKRLVIAKRFKRPETVS